MAIAIVTGGNSGIGRATCALLAERGFDVGFTWHGDEERAREAAEEIEAHGVRAAARRMDLEADVGQASVVDALAAELGGVDVLRQQRRRGPRGARARAEPATTGAARSTST